MGPAERLSFEAIHDRLAEDFPKLGNPSCLGAIKAHFDMLIKPRIIQNRCGWPLWGFLFLLAFTVGDPSSAFSRDKPVAYILKVEGQNSGAYKMGSAIRNGETINVGPATQVEVFHKSHKRCRTIKISGKISVTFGKTTYSPKYSRKVQILKEGCAPVCTPKGPDAGVTMRGSASKLILVDTAPKFLIEGDLSRYQKMKIVEQQNPQNITVLSISSSTSLVTWPSELKPLKLNSTYGIVLTGVGVSLPLQETFQTTAVRRDGKASSLVIVDLSDGN